VVWPLVTSLLLKTNAEKVTGIGTDGRAEFYLIGKKGGDPTDLLHEAQTVVAGVVEKSNGMVRLSEIRLLGTSEPVPSQPIKQVYRPKVVIDFKKASAAGLTAEDAAKAISAAIGPETNSPEGVRKLASTTMPVEGSHVILSDVATVTLEKGPDRIIRTLP
jgi:multidrug efflux pump subunit AcrB